MTDSFRGDWRRASMLLATIFGFGILGIMIILMFGGEATPAPSTVSPLCASTAEDAEKARAMIQQGLANALTDHAQHLMAVWIRDNVDESQRARKGIENGTRAFLHAQREIEAWDIPLCPK